MVARSRQTVFSWAQAGMQLASLVTEPRKTDAAAPGPRRLASALAEMRRGARPVAVDASAEPRPASPAALAREQLVGRIIARNPSADPEFLAGFDRERLTSYLERLEALETPRGREARWVRRAESPAIVGHERPI